MADEPANRPRLDRVRLAVELPLVALAALYVATFVYRQTPGLLSPYTLEWDARCTLLLPFRYHGSGLFPHDLLLDYVQAYCYPGWQAIYWLGTLFTDPRTLSRLLPFACLAVTLYYAFALGRRLGGVVLGAAACVLLVHCNWLWHRMVGATPRGFAFPLVVALLYYATCGHRRRLLVTLVLQAAIYPSCFAFSASAYGLTLLATRDRRAWLGLGLAGALAIGIVLVHMGGVSPAVGRAITIAELAPLKQRHTHDLYPLPTMQAQVKSALRHTLHNTYGRLLLPSLRAWAPRTNGWLVWGFAALLLAAAGRRLRQLPPIFAGLLISSLALFALAQALPYRLYIPERMLTFSWPVLVPVVLLAAGRLAFARWTPRFASALSGGLLVALLLGLHGDGLPVRLNLWDFARSADLPVVHFLERLPRESLIAAHPSLSSMIQTYALRKTLVSSSTNVAIFYPYAVELERRVEAWYHAVYARDLATVRSFAATFHVDYLVIDQRDFGPQALPRAAWVEPWTTLARRLVVEGATGGFALSTPPPAAIVFRDGPLIVLDLAKL